MLPKLLSFVIKIFICASTYAHVYTISLETKKCELDVHILYCLHKDFMPIFVCLLVHIKKESIQGQVTSSILLLYRRRRKKGRGATAVLYWIINRLFFSLFAAASDLMIITRLNVVVKPVKKKSVNRLEYSEG